ncbi:MAG: hypothetical protein GY816_09425 [Cytophagales bacterium]|nr:hypothetical protein [Cytophagales bacterium]
MSIEQKYFNQDKNYLLKTVQAFCKNLLLETWASEAYQAYMSLENPMGLEDDFTLSIKLEIKKGTYVLEEAYDLLAAIYRLKEGDNQLSFVWDGRTHMEYYDEQWRSIFNSWMLGLCQKQEVYRAIIKASLADKTTNTDFLESSIKRAVLDHFQIRITRSKKMHVLTA